jgi:hypothetical protein
MYPMGVTIPRLPAVLQKFYSLSSRPKPSELKFVKQNKGRNIQAKRHTDNDLGNNYSNL